MRAARVMRFVVFGAVGFGIGVVIAGAGLLIPIGGALGGASLGLALEDKSKVAILALLGALGATFGVIVVFLAGSPMWDYPVRMAAVIGAMVGASLGVGFWDWRRTLALTLAGAVGFGGGLIVGVFALQGTFGVSFMVGIWGTIILCAITGIIGGASLGAALGYLESKLVSGRRLRVR